jgi:O-antigen/teichoic acid export membrane protein
LEKEKETTTFIRNVVTLISGNVIAFVIPVILYPILSRIFTQADYALFGLYLAVFSFLEVASAGRYDVAIVLPEKDEDAANMLSGAIVISILYALLIFFLILLFKDFLSSQLNNPELKNWLVLLPLTLFLVSISKVCNGWLIRMKYFKASAINKASQKIGEGGVQLLLGTFNLGNGLIFGDLAGRVFNAIFAFFQSLNKGLNRKSISVNAICSILIRFIEIPKYGILPSMLNTLAGMLPVFVISSMYSIEVSGSFNFSRIILSVPFALISSGISQVLMQQVSERKNKRLPVYKEIVSLASKLSVLSVLGVVVLFFLGADLFEIIFGAKWRQSGDFTSILILSYAVTFIISPFSILLVVMGKIKFASFWQVFYFISISSLWLLKDLTIHQFLFVLVVIDLFCYLVYGGLIFKVVKDYERSLDYQHA